MRAYLTGAAFGLYTLAVAAGAVAIYKHLK